MRAFTLTHLSDRDLLHDLAALVTQDRATTASLLAHIAEVDARRLYASAGYPSMFEYCVRELHLSEDAAYRRITAARCGRKFPAVFAALAKGEMHLTAVLLVAPHLTPENAEGLLAAAARKSRSEVEQMLAQRFPRTELMPMVSRLPVSRAGRELAPARVEPHASTFAPRQLTPARVEAPTRRRQLAPVAPQRFELHLTMGEKTRDKLQYAKELLSHQIPSGDLAEVLDGVLDLAIAQLEKRKFAAATKPRTRTRRSTASPRHIPAHVKRAVWERDQGRCTFTGETGHRCGARKLLEYDHVDPVAHGGQATAMNVRLRCRSHNQYEAERTFGAGFMHEKRRAAREARAQTEAARQAATAGQDAIEEARAASDRDVLSCLRTLGYRADEARRAAAFSATLALAPLEQRVRLALSYFRPKIRSNRAIPAARGAM